MATALQQDSLVEYGMRRVLITITAVLAALLEVIDTTIVNVALNDMKGNLGATLSEIGWVVTSYAIGNVIIIPMTSWLSQQFGRRNYYAASIIVFTLCSFLCGNAHSLGELILFRFLQGAAGGALLVTSQTIITESFPAEKRGMAQAIYGLGVIVGPTLGPPLGGYLTETYSWPYIFYVNIPVGIAAAIMTIRYVRSPKFGEKKKAKEVDWFGIVFLAAAVGCLQFVLEKGQEEDWFSSELILIASIISAVSFYFFIWREMVAKSPIVNLRVLKDNNLKIGTILTFILGFGLYGSTFIVPLFLQNILGWSAYQAGLIMVPSSVVTALMMPVVGQLLQRGVKQQLLVAIGFVGFFCYSLWGYKILTPFTGFNNFFWMLMLRGFALSLMFIPITTLALSTLSGRAIGEGAAFTGMARQLGGSVGVAIITTFLTWQGEKHSTNLVGNLTNNSVVFQQRYNSMVGLFTSKGLALNQAKQAAYEAVFGQVIKQSTILSYMDAFLYIGLMFMICVPFVLMVKSRGKVNLSAAAH
ncbi:MFS transporter [Arachidicoccus ginsenosidimutans]|uniref:DHA2 family efflux MFS transporter permease subunit n=1 Tax=Arachidicoccus sp. BS20 TaxID=1850526 RepID=UPI0007F0FC16|nr:DHA2 family efflux MFS transporter permease subunit [Arachidicoccus sp. BS20]ANI90538.1 MFS transporter [Arachidicoccus sp. BS20]